MNELRFGCHARTKSTRNKNYTENTTTRDSKKMLILLDLTCDTSRHTFEKTNTFRPSTPIISHKKPTL